MTESCCDEGVRGNQLVFPKERAGAEQRRHREGGTWGKQGFSRATEPQAREAA